MIENGEGKRFLEKTNDLLNRAAENLDSRTRQRLEHMRMKALSGVEEAIPGSFLPLRWITFGGLATATMAAVALFFWFNTSPGDFPVKHVEDLEIITSREPIDLYQNLEFYRWMAMQNLSTGRAF